MARASAPRTQRRRSPRRRPPPKRTPETSVREPLPAPAALTAADPETPAPASTSLARTPQPSLSEPPIPEPAPSEVALFEPQLPDVALATPEPQLVARVSPPEPERPRAALRRAIFFDVENTSRAENVARILDHLAIDWAARRTDFIAVGNWRVIGADTARLLARRGAQLVHSAPSTGVRDWSDLRIAVGAGVWLAGARPGDVIEVVSDDRAFDAVGDVAAALGITFVRRSYGSLAGLAPAAAVVHEEAPAAPRGDRSRRGRRRGRRGGRPSHAPAHAPARASAMERPEGGRPDTERGEPHTAPHDEVVGVVRELVARSGERSVLIDTLANALKARGFRRPPGSPRLITRLRRIRELSVSPNGMITLVDGTAPRPAETQRDERRPDDAHGDERQGAEGHRDEPHRGEPYSGTPPSGPGPAEWEDDAADGDDPDGNVALPPPAGAAPAGSTAAGRRRRRSRRGGRGRRRHSSAQNASSA
jgi:hypothetical protein